MSTKKSRNHFEVFEIPVDLELNPALLTGKYLELQRKYHPDRYINANAAEKATALHKSAEVNEAYSILKDKFRRFEYIIELYAGNELVAPPELLMEIMELRENPPAQAVQEAEVQIAGLYRAAQEDFLKNDIEAMAQKYIKFKYLKKFVEDVTANT